MIETSNHWQFSLGSNDVMNAIAQVCDAGVTMLLLVESGYVLITNIRGLKW